MSAWQELALEYRKEIKEIWEDLEGALDELEKGAPKSYKKGMLILEKSLECSKENVRILSYTEPTGLEPKPIKIIITRQESPQPKMESNQDEDSFKWLRDPK